MRIQAFVCFLDMTEKAECIAGQGHLAQKIGIGSSRITGRPAAHLQQGIMTGFAGEFLLLQWQVFRDTDMLRRCDTHRMDIGASVLRMMTSIAEIIFIPFFPERGTALDRGLLVTAEAERIIPVGVESAGVVA